MSHNGRLPATWPSRAGLGFAFFFLFLISQTLPAFRPEADPDWNRGILQQTTLYAALAIAFAVLAFKRLGLLGRVGGILAALLSVLAIFRAMNLWMQP